jgi:flagellar protein FlbD
VNLWHAKGQNFFVQEDGLAVDKSQMRTVACKESCTQMIWLTRLNGNAFVVNAEQITYIEVTPDTVVFLADSQKIVVREPVQIVIDRAIAYRRSVLGVAPQVPFRGDSR